MPGTKKREPKEWMERGLTRVPYHIQILGGFLSLQAVVLFFSLFIVHRSFTARLEEDIRRHFQTAREVFQTTLERRAWYLARTLEALADAGTAAASPERTRARLGADFIWILDARGRVLRAAGTAPAGPAPREGVSLIAGKPFQVVSAPLPGGGGAAAGFLIDDGIVARFKNLSRADVASELGKGSTFTLIPPLRAA